MNPGLVISYIIAAILLLSMVMMNLRISGNSIEMTMTVITREHVKTITEMLNEDLPNMGYNIIEKTDPILTHASGDKIAFYRNVYNDMNRDPELITWEFLSSEEITQSENPNDRVLIRVEEEAATGIRDTTRIMTGVTGFSLRYYDTHGEDLENNMPSPGAVPSDLADVKQIYLELEMQSAEPIYANTNDPGRYIRSVYEKRYSPPNIE